MNRVLVGNYVLGAERVELYVDYEQQGANLCLCPETGFPWISLGFDFADVEELVDWQHIYASLMHEVFEAAAMRMGLRLSDTQQVSMSTSRFIFLMTHEQFEECSTRTAYYMAECEPALKRLFIQCKKKPVKRKAIIEALKIKTDRKR